MHKRVGGFNKPQLRVGGYTVMDLLRSDQAVMEREGKHEN